MIRKVLLALVMVCCLAATTVAAVTVTAGNHVLIPNTPGQVFQILISSDVPQGIQSADLGLEIIDINVGVIQPSPVITAVDMTSPGTVFGDAPAGNAGQADFEAFPTTNQLSSIATNSGDTAPTAGGILAHVTIDTTGMFSLEIFTISLTYSPFFLPTSTSSIPAQSTFLVNGAITHLPEPSSLVLGLFAAGALSTAPIRRRYSRRRRQCSAA